MKQTRRDSQFGLYSNTTHKTASAFIEFAHCLQSLFISLIIITCRYARCGCIAYSLFVCLFVRLRISPPGIKLAASNFARRFIGVQGRECPIFVNVAPPRAPNRTNRPARGPRPPGCEHYHRDTSTNTSH